MLQKKYPKDPKVLFLIANNYRGQNRCDKAIKIYDALIKVSVNKDNFYYLKAICLDKLNKWEDSKKILVELISRKPNDAYVLNYLSYSMAIRNEDIDKAIITIQQAIELEPNNSEIIDHLGDIYYKTGRKKEAIYEWKRALNGNANNKLKKDIRSKLNEIIND